MKEFKVTWEGPSGGWTGKVFQDGNKAEAWFENRAALGRGVKLFEREVPAWSDGPVRSTLDGDQPVEVPAGPDSSVAVEWQVRWLADSENTEWIGGLAGAKKIADGMRKMHTTVVSFRVFGDDTWHPLELSWEEWLGA